MGFYKNDKKNGFGLKVWSTGDKYEGEWLDGERNGKGIKTWVNGKKYEG